MPTVPKAVETTDPVHLKRLLELFPVSALRETWSEYEGTKDEIADQVANVSDRSKVLSFVDQNFGCCRQHVYLLSGNGKKIDVADLRIPAATQVQVNLKGDTTELLYFWEITFEVVTRDPIGLDVIKFTVPIKLEIFGKHVVFRFIILEKDLSSYSKTGYRSVERQGLRENQIVDLIRTALTTKYGLVPLDIHKGVKKLWDDGTFRSTKTKYKNPISTSTEEMDDPELDIKTHQPKRYSEIIGAPIITQLIFVDGFDDGFTVKKFTCSPGEGFLSFNAYSERAGDTDHVIREIIKKN